MNGRPDLSRLTARLAKFRLPALILCLGVVLMLLPGKNRTTWQTAADTAAQTSESFDLAALEHQLKYKKDIQNVELIQQELKRCADEMASTDLTLQTVRQMIQGGGIG